MAGALGICLTPADLAEGPAASLLQSKGFEILGAHQLICATLADARLAKILRTTVGAPLVHVRLQVLDLASRPIELLSAHYRTESYVYPVFLAAGPARTAEVRGQREEEGGRSPGPACPARTPILLCPARHPTQPKRPSILPPFVDA